MLAIDMIQMCICIETQGYLRLGNALSHLRRHTYALAALEKGVQVVGESRVTRALIVSFMSLHNHA
jgi:hypothetical protein